MSNFLETIDSLESKFNNLVERYLFLKEENEEGLGFRVRRGGSLRVRGRVRVPGSP